MDRKAIQLANNTLVVSLPAKWVRKNQIEKGDNLSVEDKGGALVICGKQSSSSKFRSIKIDISGMNVSLVWNYLNSVYRAGFDEIEIFFDDVIKTNIKTNKKQKTIELISNVSDKLLGMEIIRQSKNSCTLKQLTRLDSEEYTNVLNRVYLSLVNISQDLIEASKSGDFESIERLYTYSEINVNKLSDYCLRVLNIHGLEKTIDMNNNYLISFLLEEIGDYYADMGRLIINTKKLPNADLIELINELNYLLGENYRMFLKPSVKKLIDFHSKRAALKKKLESKSFSNKFNISMVFYILSVVDKLMEINNSLITCLTK